GIWTSFVYAVPFAVSIAVRRPLVGLLWEFLDPTPDPTSDSTPGGGHPPWFRRRELLRAYSYATAAGLVVFLARGIVQLTLYGQNATGWLAFARVAMGYPLYIGAVGLGFLLVRRARKRLAVRSPVSSAQDIASDGGLGLGQRDEQ
ncbi:MAG: DUF3159 domain-containing protein, partial [Jatrophihabitantaceae bacterium]